MRALLVVAFVANVMVIAATTATMPERVAIHFGPGGAADNWAPRTVNAWLFFGMSVFLFLLFYFMPALVRRSPPTLLNVPNRDYWTLPEHRETMLKKLGSSMAEFGVGIFVFLAWVEVLVALANRQEPARLDERLFYPALIAFFVYTGIWLYRMFRDFRVPERA